MTNTSPGRDPLPPTTAAPGHAGDARHPAGPPAQPGPFDLSALIAAGAIDVVDGDPPVPISVWRVAGIDHPYHHDPAGGLTPHTAALLVGSYTRPGDTLVSMGGDPALAGAAGAAGVRYVGVEDPVRLAGLDHLTGHVQLIVLRWPLPQRPGPAWTDPEHLPGLFAACRRLLTRDGCVVATLAVLPGESEADAYDRNQHVVPAAHQSGLGWLQHLIAVIAPIVGEHVSWRTTPADAATLRAAHHLRIHLDLLVFVARRRRHD